MEPDISISLGAGPLLQASQAGTLSWADVHLAQQLGFLYHEKHPLVLLGLALTSRALRGGSACLDLNEPDTATDEDSRRLPEDLLPPLQQWLDALAASPMVNCGTQGDEIRPLRLVGDLLYLERYWQDESTVVAGIRRLQHPTGNLIDERALSAAIAELFAGNTDSDQMRAAALPSLTGFTVIAGGPGTGKTHTLARLLGLAFATGGDSLRIALAAPTGKAAVRMQEALAAETATLPAQLGRRLGALRASTIHRLLGTLPGSTSQFRHGSDNPLPHDLVVVDETSMVSVTLMARLMEALRPEAHLVLIGDPNQLAPVEAGPVLADISDAHLPLSDQTTQILQHLTLDADSAVARLRTNHRSVRSINELANAVLAGDPAAVLEKLDSPGIRFATDITDTDLPTRITEIGARMVRAAAQGQATLALQELESHRLLCGHRNGPFGVSHWARQVENWIAAAVAGLDPSQTWYPGRPLLQQINSPELGLFNGDTGVIVQDPATGVLSACFSRGEQVLRLPPSLLSDVGTVHAMTVHKSQGSQFEAITLILPPLDSPLLTRELVYTAITRAKREVTLIGSKDALLRAVERRTHRASGLHRRL